MLSGPVNKPHLPRGTEFSAEMVVVVEMGFRLFQTYLPLIIDEDCWETDGGSSREGSLKKLK
jgi:hypothetical protein